VEVPSYNNLKINKRRERKFSFKREKNTTIKKIEIEG
jgi:hypothetical protein